MKSLFTTILLTITVCAVFGKTRHFTDSVEICGRKFALPEDAKLTAQNELKAADYSISWQYVTEKKQEKLISNTLSDLSKEKNFRQTDLQCYFIFKPCKAYGLTFNNEAGESLGAILIAANVNNQPVFVKIMLTKPVFINEGSQLLISSLITFVQ